MDPSNLASQSASQTSNASNTPLPGAIMPTLPLSGAVTPAFNHAIALQQYQFQQSLMNQQIVAQQQAVAHSVSIKAAAERAAARAVEISRLLNSETNVHRSVDLVAESEREKSVLEARSRSASPPQSSKPNTVSPIGYRNSRREPEEHSPRDRSGYEGRRNSSSYTRSNDLRGYSRSSYRRGEDYSGRSSYGRSRNTSWSRRRSPLSRSRYRHGDSRSPRHHVGSRSPRRHRIRSPSPISRQQTSTRASNRQRISKSPTKGGSSSTSPPRVRKVSPRKATARRSLSSSEDSPIHNTENLLLKENKDADLNAKGQESDAKPPRGNLVSGRSNSDYFGEMNSRKKSASRSPRCQVGSRSPRHHRNRSPSPMSKQRTSSRISTRHSISKISLKGGSSRSPPHSSPRKKAARGSLSSSDDSPIHNTANLLLKENKPAVMKSVSRSPRCQVGSRSPRRHRNRSPSPMSRQRTSSRISTRHSISKISLKGGSSSSPLHSGPRKKAARGSLSSSDDSPIHNTANFLLKENKPAVMKSASRDFASTSMDRSDSHNSQRQSVRRGLGSRDCKNDSETTVPPRSTDPINLPTEMLDHCSHRNDRDTNNGNGDFSMSNGKGKKLHESATEKGIEVSHRKPSRISKPSSSLEPEGNLSDHGQRNYPDKREEKMHVNKEFDMHEQELSRKVISSNEEDSANISGECAIYPLPEGHGSMGVKEVDPDGDAKADGNVSASPKVSKHREKKHKRRSISRDRKTKHRKSHHKMHRDESEEEEGEVSDKKRESHEKRKMKRREKKGRDRYH